jgi:hypothetical protein
MYEMGGRGECVEQEEKKGRLNAWLIIIRKRRGLPLETQFNNIRTQGKRTCSKKSVEINSQTEKRRGKKNKKTKEEGLGRTTYAPGNNVTYTRGHAYLA